MGHGAPRRLPEPARGWQGGQPRCWQITGTRLLLAMNGVNPDSKDIYVKSGSASVGDRKRKLGRGKAEDGVDPDSKG